MSTIKNKYSVVVLNKTYDSKEVTADYDGNKPTLLKTSNCSDKIGIGDTFTWTVIIKNPTKAAYLNVDFTDVLDTQTTYVAGSLKLNSTIVTPTSTSPLKYTIASIPAGATTQLTFDVTIVAV